MFSTVICLCWLHVFVTSVSFDAGSEAVRVGAVISGENPRHSQQGTESAEKSGVSERCCCIFMDLRSISGLFAGRLLTGWNRLI